MCQNVGRYFSNFDIEVDSFRFYLFFLNIVVLGDRLSVATSVWVLVEILGVRVLYGASVRSSWK